MKKTLRINIFVFCVLNFFIIIFSPLVVDVLKFIKEDIPYSKDKRYLLPNYDDVTWAKKHFEEMEMLKTSYQDYIIWRRKDFNGETVTIKNGYRLNYNNEVFNLKKDIWFFGGSAAWGFGVNNENTIPSLLERSTGLSTLNMGEFGYNTTQELNLLLKELVNHKPKIIIFFDGLNDAEKCRSEFNYYSSMQENILKRKTYEPKNYTENLFIAPVKIIENLLKPFYKNKIKIKYDCDIRNEKAEKIVNTFVTNWKIIESTAKENNIKFLPILQPSVFSSKLFDNNPPLDLEMKKQYDLIYSMIKIAMKRKNFDYLDLSEELDESKENFFIDFGHLSHNANNKIANRISKHLGLN